MSFAALLSIAALAFIVGRSVGAFVEPQWGGAQLLVIMAILVGAAVILPLVLSQLMPGTAAPKLLAAAMVAYGICHGAIVPSAAVAAVAADDPGARDREATLPVVHFFVAGLVGLVIGLFNPQSVTMYLVVAAILAVMSTGALIAALTAAKSRPA